MKLIDQVIGINQACMLKTLGIIQKSLFYHHPAFDKPVFGETWTTQTGKQYAKTMVCNDKKGVVSAFTVAELGVMLPHPDGMYELGGFNHPSDFDPTAKDGKPWYCMWEYDTEKYGMKRQLFEGQTEAEARAAILIHFLETNLITAEQVNARLCQ